MADARVWAARHVAHRIAARFASRDPDAGQPTVHIGRVLDVDEMELHVLPGGNVQDAVRVLLGAVCQYLELLSGEFAERNLDPLHPGRIELRVRPLRQTAARKRDILSSEAVVSLSVVVTLAVCASTESKLREYLLIELAGLPELHLVLEQIDLLCDNRWDLRGECLPPR